MPVSRIFSFFLLPFLFLSCLSAPETGRFSEGTPSWVQTPPSPRKGFETLVAEGQGKNLHSAEKEALEDLTLRVSEHLGLRETPALLQDPEYRIFKSNLKSFLTRPENKLTFYIEEKASAEDNGTVRVYLLARGNPERLKNLWGGRITALKEASFYLKAFYKERESRLLNGTAAAVQKYIDLSRALLTDPEPDFSVLHVLLEEIRNRLSAIRLIWKNPPPRMIRTPSVLLEFWSRDKQGGIPFVPVELRYLDTDGRIAGLPGKRITTGVLGQGRFLYRKNDTTAGRNVRFTVNFNGWKNLYEKAPKLPEQERALLISTRENLEKHALQTHFSVINPPAGNLNGNTVLLTEELDKASNPIQETETETRIKDILEKQGFPTTIIPYSRSLRDLSREQLRAYIRKKYPNEFSFLLTGIFRLENFEIISDGFIAEAVSDSNLSILNSGEILRSRRFRKRIQGKDSRQTLFAVFRQLAEEMGTDARDTIQDELKNRKQP